MLKIKTKIFKQSISLLLAGLLLSGCTKVSIIDPTDEQLNQQQGPCQQAYQAVKGQSIQVVQTGDKLKFVLPADKFYTPASTSLKLESMATLTQVANLLQCYTKVNVQIFVYTDDRTDPQLAKQITQQQAQSIANYLWDQSIDTRILMPIGMGQTKPVADNATLAGQSQNRRIEITFWRVTEPLL